MKAIALGQLDPDLTAPLVGRSCLFAGLYGYSIFFTHGTHDRYLEGKGKQRVTQEVMQRKDVLCSLNTAYVSTTFMLTLQMGNPKQLACLLDSFQDYNFSDGSSGQLPRKTEILHQQLLHVTLLSYNKVHLSPLYSLHRQSKISMEFHVKPEEIRQTKPTSHT